MCLYLRGLRKALSNGCYVIEHGFTRMQRVYTDFLNNQLKFNHKQKQFKFLIVSLLNNYQFYYKLSI